MPELLIVAASRRSSSAACFSSRAGVLVPSPPRSRPSGVIAPRASRGGRARDGGRRTGTWSEAPPAVAGAGHPGAAQEVAQERLAKSRKFLADRLAEAFGARAERRDVGRPRGRTDPGGHRCRDGNTHHRRPQGEGTRQEVDVGRRDPGPAGRRARSRCSTKNGNARWSSPPKARPCG